MFARTSQFSSFHLSFFAETVYLPILIDTSLAIAGPTIPVAANIVHATLSSVDDKEKVKFICVKP